MSVKSDVAVEAAGAASKDEHPLQTHVLALFEQSAVVGGAFRAVHPHGAAARVDFGLQCVEDGTPVSGSTIFHWASVTKILTGIGIMQLRDAGMLNLSDSVVVHLPELAAVHSEFGPVARVTLWHLLTHSSGFRAASWPWLGELGTRERWHPFEPESWQQIVAMLPYTSLLFEPGTRSQYSNLGILFLGRVIEVVSGLPYVEYVRARVLEPLGMAESFFDKTPQHWLPRRAASYTISTAASDEAAGMARPRYTVVDALPFDPSTGVTVSNSGLNAPLDDMTKLVQFLMGGVDADAPLGAAHASVLRRSSVLEMATHQLDVVPGQVEGGCQGIGLILFRERYGVHTLWGHSGDQNGFTCHLYCQLAEHCSSSSRSAAAGYVVAYNSQVAVRGDGASGREALLSEAELDARIRDAALACLFVPDAA